MICYANFKTSEVSRKATVAIRCEVSGRMAADIFTKAFVDKIKLTSACWLIDLIDSEVLKHCV